jgi:predicted O-methyltransferase YrrM
MCYKNRHFSIPIKRGKTTVLQTIYFLILLISIVIVGLVILLYVRKKFRNVSAMIVHQQRHIWETHNIVRVISGMASFPVPGGWTASTDILGELARHISTQKPSLVVELGSGFSTVVIAAALKQNGGGRLVSIDADKVYAEKTREQLALHGLADWVDVRFSQISEMTFEGENRLWYDTSKFDDLGSIDLLFIDGPSTAVCNDVRRPSLPWFWNKLKTGATVLLDDAARPVERAISDAWQKSFPSGKFEFLPFEKGAIRIIKQS